MQLPQEMNWEKKQIYEMLWGKKEIPAVPTKYRGKESSNSLALDGEIDEYFSLNPNVFSKKYQEAISGSGSEGKRIKTLHSSSLCAFLHFYDVDENHIVLALNGSVCTFTKSEFEVQNKVFDNPSNMDVVLRGTNEQGKPVVLFLESKMTEYICNRCKTYYIPMKYKDKGYYSESFLEKLGLTTDGYKNYPDSNGNPRFQVKANIKDANWYIGGIKQMVSHYIGVTNYSNEENAKLYLGTILFDQGIGNIKDSLADYKHRYEILVQAMKEKEHGSKIDMLETVLLYSNPAIKNRISRKIRDFYY